MAYLMTAKEFINKAVEISKTKTAYMWGTYGRPITTALIDAKKKQYPKQYTDSRVARLRALVGQGYHAWDCVGLIKGILWGWDGKNRVKYAVNGVPDADTKGMMRRCTHRSTDFSKILPGCIMYKPGHVGIYIGNGLAVEATSAWDSKVMVTAVSNIGRKSGYKRKSWTEHGRLPWIDYQEETIMKKVEVITPEEKAREWAGENIVKPGMTGKLVEVVQYLLMLKGYNVIVIDGIFGDVTKKQVVKFQEDMGLVKDGCVGPVTLEALMK